MAQTNRTAPAQTSEVICARCQARFGSDTELRAHIAKTHPESSTERDERGCATSFLMEERGEQNKLCEETPAERKEEYVQPEKEKEAGGEG